MIPIIGEVWTVNDKKAVIVSPHGPLTSEDGNHLYLALMRASIHSPDLMVVDFAKCPAIAEEPKKVLISFFTQAGQEGILAFAGANSAIRKSMVPTKLEALFVTHQAVVDALAAFAPPSRRENW